MKIIGIFCNLQNKQLTMCNLLLSVKICILIDKIYITYCFHIDILFLIQLWNHPQCTRILKALSICKSNLLLHICGYSHKMADGDKLGYKCMCYEFMAKLMIVIRILHVDITKIRIAKNSLFFVFLNLLVAFAIRIT